MAAPKIQFLRNVDEVKKTLGLVRSDSFENFLIHSLAEFQTRNPSHDQSQGVSMFVEILKTIADAETETPTWEQVTSSNATLRHEIEVPDRTQPKAQKKEK